MKNVLKVLFVLFLMNSTGLCANENNAPLGHPQREEYYVGNRRHDEEVAENIRRRILDNTVEDDAEDAVGGVDVDQEDRCYLCWDNFTEEKSVYKKLMDNTCMHQKLHKKCLSNKVCSDDECCLHKAIRNWRQNHNGLVQCPSRCRKTKINNVFELLPMLVRLSPEERLAEKKRLLLVKAGRILRVATYTGLFIQNCREKDAFDRAVKMLILSALMSGDRIIEKALNTIRESGVTTLKQKLEIIMKECFKNMFHMISTNSIPQIFAGFIKVKKLDNIPFIANQLFAHSLCSFPTDLYGVATGYNEDIRSKLFVGLEKFKSISSVVLNTSIAGSLSFKLDPIPQLLTREQIIDELHLVDPSDSLMKSQLLLNTMVNLVQDIAANERYKKGLGNLRGMVASSAAFTLFELARLFEKMPIFNRN